MEQPGVAELLELVLRERRVRERAFVESVDRLRQGDREFRHADRVTGRGRIPLIDRRRRGADEAVEEVLDVADELLVLDRDRGLSGEREHHLDVLHRVAEHVRVGVRLGSDGRLGILLPIDQLEHADHLVAVVLHRHHEHRLRPVSVLLVEAPVEGVRRLLGDLVGVLEDDRLALGRDEPGDRRAIEREGEVRIRKVGEGVVLRPEEAQVAGAVRGLLHEVERTRVRDRESPGLPEDHREQRALVPLGHERDADAIQFLDLLRCTLRAGGGDLGVEKGFRMRARRAKNAHQRATVGREVLGRQEEPSHGLRQSPTPRVARDHGDVRGDPGKGTPVPFTLGQTAGQVEDRRNLIVLDVGQRCDLDQLEIDGHGVPQIGGLAGRHVDPKAEHHPPMRASAASNAARASSMRPSASRISPFSRSTSALTGAPVDSMPSIAPSAS